MAGYIIRRLLGMIPTLLIILFMVVVLVRLIPGNIIDIILQEQRGVSQIDRQALAERLGVDDPLPVQYAKYVAGAAQGDLGKSLWNQQSVSSIIMKRLPVSLELAIMSLIVSIFVALVVGVISAVRQDSLLDYSLRSFAILGLSIPNFALGTMIVVLPAVYFGWTPPLFFKDFSEDPWGHISHFFIPAAVLGLAVSASLMRLTRTMMLEVLRQDYVRTAWSKGLSERVIIYRHALKNAMIPVVTLLGLQVAFALSGSVIMEQIFALPGMGRLLIESIATRDYPIVQGITVVIGVWVLIVNLLIDLSYAFLDPRVKVGGGM